ncbi:MAG TPA: PLP-dependent lyase/thiolase [Clostridiaceae bacterium]|nr:PLP-dependent lyase/thiolase [Clostridiaceae bacterium]
MSKSLAYADVMARKNEIMKQSTGIDYSQFEQPGRGFSYEALMAAAPKRARVEAVLSQLGVGNTPLLRLDRVSALVRSVSKEGLGATILLKDEAANPSGSFKARRAALSVFDAWEKGYQGVIAATSGNYGAAVAAMAAKLGLKCIILQECYDSHFVGQPEILEKQRHCEALGAEVISMTVGPELFYEDLKLLEETGYYNASLYVPAAIAGIESLGWEIAAQTRHMGIAPAAVVITHAGGGNLTGTARGLKAEGLKTSIVAASVDLTGLHMASDRDFNRKSFTTGHTGFGIPFAVKPDRSDVPRNAARALRYMDDYLLVKQGEVFYATEMLAALEGIERGPAGNTSLAAAFALARTLPASEYVVVQETEYTGAGKHPQAQLAFAAAQGVSIEVGDPADEVPGQSIVLPDSPARLTVRRADLDSIRQSALRRLFEEWGGQLENMSAETAAYFAAETHLDEAVIVPRLRKELKR